MLLLSQDLGVCLPENNGCFGLFISAPPAPFGGSVAFSLGVYDFLLPNREQGILFCCFFLFFLILSGFLLLLNSPLGAAAVLIAPALVAVLLKKTKRSDP